MGRTDLEHTTDIYIFVMPVVNQFDLFSFISSCFDFLVKEEGRKVCMYVCVGGGKKGRRGGVYNLLFEGADIFLCLKSCVVQIPFQHLFMCVCVCIYAYMNICMCI